MNPHLPHILGLESSCDETAAAVVRGGIGGSEVLSNVIASQHDLHAEYSGVVPEIASRAHVERMLPVLRRALAEAGVAMRNIDAIAVGHRPGLIGSLLIAVSAAKALAWSLGKPLIGVDHVQAHLYAGFLKPAEARAADAPPGETADIEAHFPALGLVVSGGHTSIYQLRSPLEVRRIGSTIDDAVGEAYDKAAAILGLPYPGGPHLDKLARTGNDRALDFPIARLSPDSLDFSFSGLKTAVLYAVRGVPKDPRREPRAGGESNRPPPAPADIAASFQRAAVRAITLKLERAFDRLEREGARPASLLVGGGVSANSRLRAELADLARARGVRLAIPPLEYCLDNAAMIAGLGACRLAVGESDDLTLSASPASAI